MIDTDNQDHEFFDILYQQWSKTTWVEDSYWMPEKYGDGTSRWKIYASNGEELRLVASDLQSEADADFITGLHGAVPDLIRRLHEAIDEATRKDEANDIAQGQLADALLENVGLRAEIHELERQLEESKED